MPGFFIYNNSKQYDLKEKKYRTSGVQKMCIPNKMTILRNTLPKFVYDKTFEEMQDLYVVLEGYLLNKNELFLEYSADTVADLMNIMMKKKGETFFREFRGCFSGAIYRKSDNQLVIFTNQIGDSPVFYYFDKKTLLIGSQVDYIIQFCKENNLSLTFNESCAYQMLTYGFIPSGETYALEIKRLHGGDYLVVKDGILTVKQYHRFKKNPNRFIDYSEEQLIDLIDSSFKKAVLLEWEKDEEYGYSHLADLSGGLDSRMNMWVAHELKQRHVTNITYCKANYLDEKIAEDIAWYWKDEMLFKPLDDATFMKDIDENTFLLGGLSLFSGITGGKRFLSTLNLTPFGLEHTGMVGDAILGSFFSHTSDMGKKIPSGMYSEKLKNKLPKYICDIEKSYFDYEIYLLYTRGFHGACNTHLLRRHYTEVASPFLNVDFLQLCLDIPYEIRMNHNLYKKWIISKYPEAAKYKWEKQKGRITEWAYITYARKIGRVGISGVLRVFGKSKKDSRGMNPIDYWIENNEELSLFLDKYKEKELEKFSKIANNDLISDMKNLYENGNASEKAMVLTVLSSAKLYFGE